MNRDNLIERKLLSRSYDCQDRIEELLATRYSITGDQKPSILFKQPSLDSDKVKSLLHNEVTTTVSRARQINTRAQVKGYIEKTLSNQRKLVNKIRLFRKANSGGSFPVETYLNKFNIPRFEHFITMNNLWQSYMNDLLFPNGNVPAMSVILPKLSSADFHGCLVTVIQSKNTHVVGTRGIVVCDTQHSFIVCVPREADAKEWNESKTEFSPTEIVGGFRAIPKKGTLFGFDVITNDDECIGFTIIGSRFEFRPVDRSGKKFKNHNVDDI